MSDDNRRFDPTEQRRKQFREDGRFARAKDASGLAATAGALGVLLGSRDAIGGAFQHLFRATLGNVDALTRGQPSDVLQLAAGTLGAVAAPTIVAGSVAALIVGIAQAGIHVDFGSVGFKAGRFDVIGRLKALVNPKQSAIEILLSVARVGLVGYLAYRAAAAQLPDLLALTRMPFEASLGRMIDVALRVVLGAGAALGGIALVDYAQSRYKLEQDLKMTRQELTQEMRQQDGDPKVKGRIRARARAMAKKRAMQNVKKAHVVVTNPTHIAVALRYDDGDVAPVVVAKGQDDDALRIRAEARTYGIPILENRPLARALDAEVPVGHPVPMAHFAAVARVLAFVYRLPGRRRGTRRA